MAENPMDAMAAVGVQGQWFARRSRAFRILPTPLEAISQSSPTQCARFVEARLLLPVNASPRPAQVTTNAMEAVMYKGQSAIAFFAAAGSFVPLVSLGTACGSSDNTTPEDGGNPSDGSSADGNRTDGSSSIDGPNANDSANGTDGTNRVDADATDRSSTSPQAVNLGTAGNFAILAKTWNQHGADLRRHG